MLPITFTPYKNTLKGVFINNFIIVKNMLEFESSIYFFYPTSWVIG